MSKERVEELNEEELEAYNEEYLDWHNEQVRLDQEADDQEYLKWYLGTKSQQPKAHAKKEIGSKIGTRKHALATDKWQTDRKALKQGLEMDKILKLAKAEDDLLERAESEYAKGNEGRAEELYDNAMAVEDRVVAKIYSEKPWERGRAVRRRERENARNAQLQAQQKFDAEVEETYGEESGEFVTLADKEAHDKRVAAGKKAAVTRKENQAKKDEEYRVWCEETKSK